MAEYLLDNPPVRDQFRRTRREAESGVIVVHSAENATDISPPDTGAEAVARFIRTRRDAGSYHGLADSDSRIHMMPWSFEAYQDATGSNRHAIGISVACRAADWPKLSPEWRDGAVTNLAVLAAEGALYIKERRGIVVPARIITRAQSERREPGFISHGARDPGRRSDPGIHFPWDLFLARYHYFMFENGLAVPHVPAAPVPPTVPVGSKLVIDGDLGPKTISRLQESLNVTGARPPLNVDGWFGGWTSRFLPNIGPNTTRALQARLNHTHGPVAIDSKLGPKTIRALQRSVGSGVDGKWGEDTTRKLQQTLNNREL